MDQFEEYDQTIHLADGDNKAASKLITEIRRSPVENSLQNENSAKWPIAYIVFGSIMILAVLIVLFII
jgi:hypothetical protein